MARVARNTTSQVRGSMTREDAMALLAQSFNYNPANTGRGGEPQNPGRAGLLSRVMGRPTSHTYYDTETGANVTRDDTRVISNQESWDAFIELLHVIAQFSPKDSKGNYIPTGKLDKNGVATHVSGFGTTEHANAIRAIEKRFGWGRRNIGYATGVANDLASVDDSNLSDAAKAVLAWARTNNVAVAVSPETQGTVKRADTSPSRVEVSSFADSMADIVARTVAATMLAMRDLPQVAPASSVPVPPVTPTDTESVTA